MEFLSLLLNKLHAGIINLVVALILPALVIVLLTRKVVITWGDKRFCLNTQYFLGKERDVNEA